jgi:hypothetical protein
MSISATNVFLDGLWIIKLADFKAICDLLMNQCLLSMQERHGSRRRGSSDCRPAGVYASPCYSLWRCSTGFRESPQSSICGFVEESVNQPIATFVSTCESRSRSALLFLREIESIAAGRRISCPDRNSVDGHRFGPAANVRYCLSGTSQG